MTPQSIDPRARRTQSSTPETPEAAQPEEASGTPLKWETAELKAQNAVKRVAVLSGREAMAQRNDGTPRSVAERHQLKQVEQAGRNAAQELLEQFSPLFSKMAGEGKGYLLKLHGYTFEDRVSMLQTEFLARLGDWDPDHPNGTPLIGYMSTYLKAAFASDAREAERIAFAALDDVLAQRPGRSPEQTLIQAEAKALQAAVVQDIRATVAELPDLISKAIAEQRLYNEVYGEGKKIAAQYGVSEATVSRRYSSLLALLQETAVESVSTWENNFARTATSHYLSDDTENEDNL